METLKILNYVPRIADKTIAENMEAFGAVVIEGPKWCGKTSTAKNHAVSEISMADPLGDFQNRRLAELEPAIALEGARPRLIDEWQDVPKLWDAVRFECDRATEKGQFVLTGSSTPRRKQNPHANRPRHSGAGRIVRVPMSTMTQYELGQSNGKVSLRGLFEGERYASVSQLSLERIAELVVAGGWPDAIGSPTAKAVRIAKGYLQAVINEDIHEVDGVERDREKVRRLIVSLARNEATLATGKTILKDTQGRAEDAAAITAPTMSDYLDALRRIYFVQDIPAWAPELRSSAKIRSAAKRHLADPSLAAAALGATAAKLMGDLKTLGFLFESLVAHDLIVYAEAMGAAVYHYHDAADLEADLIIEHPDGMWIPVEVKLGAAQVDDAAKNLVALKEKMMRGGYQAPVAMLAVIGVGGVATCREDGVQVAPLDTLGV